jgi:hypothetical protein
MGLLRRPTPGKRGGRTIGSALRGGCWSAVSGRGRPPSPWPGHKPGSGSAAPRPAGPAGWPGSGAADRPAELGAQIHQQPGPRTQQPVTAQTPIGPDRPHNLVVDHPLDPEPGQRPNRLTLRPPRQRSWSPPPPGPAGPADPLPRTWPAAPPPRVPQADRPRSSIASSPEPRPRLLLATDGHIPDPAWQPNQAHSSAWEVMAVATDSGLSPRVAWWWPLRA